MTISAGAAAHHGTGPASSKAPPDGPSGPSVDSFTMISAPCATVRGPLWRFRSVATYPGHAELTLIVAPGPSSLAMRTVSSLRAVFVAEYPKYESCLATFVSGLDTSPRDPSELVTLTILPAADLRSRGRNA